MKAHLARLLKYIYLRSGLREWLLNQPVFDLAGEKALDHGWVLKNLPQKVPCKILDVGCSESALPALMVALGHCVHGVDISADGVYYEMTNFTFTQVDFNLYEPSQTQFDVVVMCSSVEHFGLAGRYGVGAAETNADLRAMKHAAELLRPGGYVILTVPVGLDDVFPPWHRVYGEHRLPLLLEEYSISRSRFYAKDRGDKWREVSRSIALSRQASASLYSLGQFVLVPQGSG